jgi:hypothetical protein
MFGDYVQDLQNPEVGGQVSCSPWHQPSPFQQPPSSTTIGTYYRPRLHRRRAQSMKHTCSSWSRRGRRRACMAKALKSCCRSPSAWSKHAPPPATRQLCTSTYAPQTR